MGIFVEDLLHFGNLMDREIPVDLYAEDLKSLFGDDKEVSVEEEKIRVSATERGLLLKRRKEKILNIKGPADGLSIRVEVVRDDFDKREGFREDLNLKTVIGSKDIFQKIPPKIRNRLFIARVLTVNNVLKVFLKFR